MLAARLFVLAALLAACAPREQGQRSDTTDAGTSAASFAGIVDPDSVRRARSALLARIDASGTYLGPMLADLDSVLRRWPDRRADPIRVHIPPYAFDPAQTGRSRAVQEAFRRWVRVGAVPVEFRFDDSATAEVHVRWIRRFESERTGQADITWSGDGWIRRGVLTLAAQSAAGWELSDEAVYTVALHEIGHLLGLGHSNRPRDVMYRSTEIHDVTARDAATARLLYALPPGSLKLP